jgi:hypothetical protein
MKARQNADDSTRAYERDAKMTPTSKGTGARHYFRVLGELILVLLFLTSSLLIVLTIMQG